MNLQELIQAGQELTVNLQQEAERFYVRSDQYETISWESSVVQARVEHLSGGAEPTHFLTESRLDATNSRMLSSPIYQAAVNFHQAYDQWRK